MPLLTLETNVPISPEKTSELLAALSAVTAKTIGKPEQYVMATLRPAAILMSGQPGNAARVDVRSIGGLTGPVNAQLSAAICRLLQASLGVSPERVYLNFSDVKASHWGWNGETFG